MKGGLKEVGVRLKVEATGLEGADKLSRSLKDLGYDTSILDKRAAELSEQLGKLGADQRLINNFTNTKAASEQAARGLAEAQAAAQKLGREFGATEEPTKKQTAALTRAREEVGRAKQAYQDSVLALQNSRKALADAGISSDNLAEAQVRVRKQTAEAKAAVDELNASYKAAEGLAKHNIATQERLAKETAEAGQAAIKAAAQQVAAGKDVAGGLEGIGSKLGDLGRLAAGGVLGVGTTQFLRSAAETADAFSNLRARIQLVTGEGAPLQEALKGIEEIALRTGASLENTGNLFARVLTAGKEINLTQEQALALTESINQAVALSGASAQASDAAITQLIQGLQSGVVRGEEFNSIMEQSPRLAQALADGLGVTRGQLRGLAQDGKLTAEAVIGALQSQSGALKTEFAELPATIARSLENLRTQWTLFVAGLNDSTGATAAVAEGINAIADNLDDIAGMATRAGAVLVAAMAIQGVGALRALAAQALASAGAMGVLTTSINQVPKVVNIAVAVTGFEAGYQVGRMLSDNSELARKFGYAMIGMAKLVVEASQLARDAVSSIFTEDTLAASLSRFRKNTELIAADFKDLWESAKDAPGEVGKAADAAGAELTRTGQAATKAGTTIADAGKAGAAGVATIATAATTVETAINELATAADRKLPGVGVEALIQASKMAELAGQSESAAKRLSQELPEAISKLNSADLEPFRRAVAGAFDATENGAAIVEKVLVETGQRAAQLLGVDVAAAGGKLSKEFASAEKVLGELVVAFPALSRAGFDAGQIVEQALQKMTAQAKNQAEFEALRKRIEALGEAGLISERQVVGMLKEISKQARDGRHEIVTVDDALEELGLTASTQAQETADRFESAYKRIRDEASVSVRTQIEGFAKWRDAAIKANDGVEPSQVALNRRILESRANAAGLGDEFERRMAQAGRATDGAREKVRGLASDLGKAQTEAQRYAELVTSWYGRLADGAGLGGIGPQGRIGSDAYAKERDKRVDQDLPVIDSFGNLIRNTKSGEITRSVSTGDAVNKPAGGEWVYTLAGFDVPGVNAAGQKVAGGWKNVGIQMTTDSPLGPGSGFGVTWNPRWNADGSVAPLPAQAPSPAPVPAPAPAQAGPTGAGVYTEPGFGQGMPQQAIDNLKAAIRVAGGNPVGNDYASLALQLAEATRNAVSRGASAVPAASAVQAAQPPLQYVTHLTVEGKKLGPFYSERDFSDQLMRAFERAYQAQGGPLYNY